ncbi:MAG TPA: hypothetical protein VKP30_08645, partial [Polyangiaceae bacterium]|nr:hypothetical protein [Polyangiaceae bacterium]
MRNLTVGALTFAAAFACSDGGSGPPTAAPNAGASAFEINIDLPPDVEARVREIVRELSGLICQRSRKCCSHYGFHALTDCTELAAAPFILESFAATDLGTLDASQIDASIDETMAALCLETTRSVIDQCIFPAEERLHYAWYLPCSRALSITAKGTSVKQCRGEGDELPCVAHFGQGYGCHRERCVPIVEVATGAACGRAASEIDIKPQCASTDCCPDYYCEPMVAVGESCNSNAQCLGDAYCSADSTNQVCTNGAELGESCLGTNRVECKGGLECRCEMWGCSEPHCVV